MLLHLHMAVWFVKRIKAQRMIRTTRHYFDKKYYAALWIAIINEIIPGKNKNVRHYMALSKLSLQVLAKQRKMLKKLGIISPWVFPDKCRDMLKPHHLYKNWAYYSKQHGINCSLHEIRHTMISVAKADVPKQLLKQAVGHTLNQLEGEIARVANILDNVFNAILQ